MSTRKCKCRGCIWPINPNEDFCEECIDDGLCPHKGKRHNGENLL